MDVLKRSGKKQLFSITKLERSIANAAKDAKISADKKAKLVKEIVGSVVTGLKGKRVVKAVELRARVLRRLDRRARAVAGAWRKYDERRH